jgi:hypothetical protein
MRRFVLAPTTLILLLTASCLPTPPPELLYTATPEPSATVTSASAQSPTPAATPVTIEIGGRMVTVDRIIDGRLCNDAWQGVVYVSPDVQVNPWTDDPTFLRECNLQVSEGTIVHVAAHPGEVFYRGCTCHE